MKIAFHSKQLFSEREFQLIKEKKEATQVMMKSLNGAKMKLYKLNNFNRHQFSLFKN